MGSGKEGQEVSFFTVKN